MSPKISSRLLLCYFAVLLVAFLGQSSDGATYKDFERQHIDYPDTPADNPDAYCNLMMQRREMTTHSCKDFNVFIHYDAESIQKTCSSEASSCSSNVCNSYYLYRLTLCRNTGHYPNCNYVGTQKNSRIQVACAKGLPVEFVTCLKGMFGS